MRKGSIKLPPVRLSTAQQLDLLDGISLGVLWLDRSGKIQYLNAAASEILQHSLNQVRGVAWSSIDPALFADLSSLGAEKITVHEHMLNLADGQKVRVSATLSPYALKDDKGEMEEGWLIELFNIERHQRIVEEDERFHQYEAGSMLVKTLAHEVKNPLAGIYGSAQLLEKKLSKQEEAEKYTRFTQVILKETQRLKQLVDRMLGPKRKGEKEPHNIHELIRYVLEVLATEKPESVAVKLDYDPSIPEIAMDFESMVQALMNLVLNAYQAMTEHGGIVTIKTRVERRFTLGTKTHPLVAVISVRDEGEGIPDKMFDSIFYPMVTSKQNGTGLGLSVSQAIVRDHGGLIVAESEPGNTVFKMYLPFETSARDGDTNKKG